jgi:hypothetical protein
MRAFLIATLCLALGLAFGLPGLAQTSDAEPASKEDVEVYLRTMHSHDTMLRTMEAMLKPMHQMLHEQFARDGKKPPADFERRYNKMMDDLMKGMPFDEMTQSVVPIYQKHFTKGDIDHLNAFYSSPTGQKVLEEMPAITGESMQAMMPVMRKYMDESKDRMQQEVKQMEKDAPSTDANPSAQP